MNNQITEKKTDKAEPIGKILLFTGLGILAFIVFVKLVLPILCLCALISVFGEMGEDVERNRIRRFIIRNL